MYLVSSKHTKRCKRDIKITLALEWTLPIRTCRIDGLLGSSGMKLLKVLAEPEKILSQVGENFHKLRQEFCLVNIVNCQVTPKLTDFSVYMHVKFD